MISTSRILVKLDKSFVNNILPIIDGKASQHGKTRADIIRTVLYSYYYHQPKERSQEQLTHDHNIEQEYNTEGYIDGTLVALP